MHIVLLTIGSRGDVQPFVALGQGLQRAGHSVRLAAPADFEEMVRGYGLDFAPTLDSARESHQRPEVRQLMNAGNNGRRLLRSILRMIHATGDQLQENSWRACQGADAIIFLHNVFPGWHLAEKYGLPCASVNFFPPIVPPTRLRRGSVTFSRTLIPDHLTEGLVHQLSWLVLRRRINRWRAEKLDLPPLPRVGPIREIWRLKIPFYGAYSPSIVPRPAYWADWRTVTGCWFLDGPSDWRPPEGLRAFLDAGPPPVLIGFGSMVPEDPSRLTSVAIEALQRTGQREILQSGWAGLGRRDLPDDLYLADDAPHDWLFPRVAAVVHHGGAGTVATALRAGIPSILTPFFGDQFFWGCRLEALGVSPPALPLQLLTAERLAGAIRAAVEDREMRERTAALGRTIKAEDGVGRTVKLFESYLRSPEAARVRDLRNRALGPVF